MIRFNCVVLASVLMLLTVTACNNEADVAPSPSPVVVKKKNKPQAATQAPGASPSPGKARTAVAPASTAKPKAQNATAAKNTGSKQTLARLNGYLPAAVRALQANNVAQAKEYAKGFSDNWQQKIIQNNVKNKSQASYNKIAAAVTRVNNSMKPANPNKAQAIASLRNLSQTVTQYTKSP